MKKYQAYAILFLAMLAVGWSAIFIRFCEGLDPLLIAFYRMAWASLILLPFSLIQFKQKFSGIAKRDIVLMISVGFVLTLHFITWTISLFHTTVASSTVLVTTQPIFLVLFSAFIPTERVRKLSVLSILIAMTGAAIIGWGDLSFSGSHIKGDLLALAGAVFAAIYLFVGRLVRQRVANLPYIQIVYTSSAVFLLIAALLFTEFKLVFSGSYLFWLVLLGLIPTVLGHSLYNWSLKKIKAYIVGASVLGEPLGASIYAWLIFNEIPSFSTVLGAVFIFCGVALLFYMERKNIT